ncbi:MAG: hypothetical protein J6P56_05425 [Bacteroidales bacterium]|nr:hypothetical protein [Bacteroidales bacterium]
MRTELDIIAEREFAVNEAKVEGRAEGRAEGIAESISKLLAHGIEANKISEALEIPLEQVLAVKNK